jgi:small subunit ribosomal protein S15
MISKENKTEAIAGLARNKTDVGSPEVQASIFTVRIKELTEHMKQHKHDFMARRGLVQLVGKRKRVLAYLKDKDFAAYKDTISKLGLRK